MTYTPESAAFSGDVTFTYQADDGQAVSNTATVTLTVVLVDTDDDGVADACEDDTDGDGILDDGDGSGDPSDNLCQDGQTEDCDDNCRITQNPDQTDFDNNGEGDEGADDIDGDNVLNVEDECERVPGVPEFLGCPEEDPGASGCGCSSTLAANPVTLGGSLLLIDIVGAVLLWPRRRRKQ